MAGGAAPETANLKTDAAQGTNFLLQQKSLRGNGRAADARRSLAARECAGAPVAPPATRQRDGYRDQPLAGQPRGAGPGPKPGDQS